MQTIIRHVNRFAEGRVGRRLPMAQPASYLALAASLLSWAIAMLDDDGGQQAIKLV